MTNCINFLANWFKAIFDWLDSIELFSGVSILGIVIAFVVLFIIVDNFVPKG